MDFAVEEVFFLMIADSINKGEGPVIYDGQLTHVFAVHPPLYVYVIAYSLKLFNDPELSARIVSLICTLLSGILLYFLSLKLLKSEVYSLLTLLLFFISPFVIQSGIHVDINGSLLILFVTLFVYLYSFNIKGVRYALCPLVLGLILWAKLEGFGLLMASVFIYYLLQKKYKRALFETAYLSFMGAVIFLFCWYFVSIQLHMDFFLPFTYLYRSIGSSSPSFAILFQYLWVIKNIILWTGLPLAMGVGIYTLNHIKKLNIIGRDKYLFFLIIYSWVVFFAFMLIPRTQQGFPKYSITLMPFFILSFAAFLEEANILFTLKKHYLEVIGSIIISVLTILWFKDPFLLNNIFYIKSIDLHTDLMTYLFSNILTGLFIIIVPLAVLITLFFMNKLLRKRKIKHIIALTLLVSFLVGSIYVDVIQVKADYSTTQGYGRNGIKKAGDYINSITGEEDNILAERDVAYYAERSFYIVYPCSGAQLEEAKEIMNNNPEYFKAAAISPSANKDLRRLIEKRCKFDRRIGVIDIFMGCRLDG